MRVRATAMAIGACVGLALDAASVDAQDSAIGPPEQVIVTSPPNGPQRSMIGAPIVDVSVSRDVRFDDLDLRTDSGARTLRGRITFAARTLCDRLNAMYPATYDGLGSQWPFDRNCYRGAIDRAMPQADAAINAARVGYGGR